MQLDLGPNASRAADAHGIDAIACGGPARSVTFGASYVDPKERAPGQHLRRAQSISAIADGVLGPPK